jgi:hypothetical protein
VAGGVAVSFYIFNTLKKEPISEVVVEEKIIPYNNLITLANVTNESLGEEISKISPSNGISILKISGTNGILLQKPKALFNFLGISLPATLERTLKEEYAVGIISQNGQTSHFLVITVSDFGNAFSGMLDWEENMEKDLSFLNEEKDTWIIDNVPVSTSLNVATSTAVGTTTATTTGTVVSTTIAKTSATSTASTTVISVKIPMKPDSFSWKDVIVKNKDTRALVNEKKQAKIAYTFLDKNTILITNNLTAVGDISSIYASRSIVR